MSISSKAASAGRAGPITCFKAFSPGNRYTTSSSWRRLYVAFASSACFAKNRPVQLALAVITLAVQVIYILIEMNALGSW
jgi:hypothetical protein